MVLLIPHGSPWRAKGLVLPRSMTRPSWMVLPTCMARSNDKVLSACMTRTNPHGTRTILWLALVLPEAGSHFPAGTLLQFDSHGIPWYSHFKWLALMSVVLPYRMARPSPLGTPYAVGSSAGLGTLFRLDSFQWSGTPVRCDSFGCLGTLVTFDSLICFGTHFARWLAFDSLVLTILMARTSCRWLVRSSWYSPIR